MRILFIDIDTLRPDHLGCYGYQRNTSPHLDRMAREGVRFDRVYCSNAPCLPSRASLVTGRFGIHSGVTGHGGTAADRRLTGAERGFRDPGDMNNLFNVFRKAGMHTVSVSTFAERHSAWWFNAGFHEMINVGKCGMESGEEVLPAALEWLGRHGRDDDWFFHLHLWDPHTPYRAPARFGNPFEDTPLPAWLTDEVFAGHLSHVGPHSANEINMFNDQEKPDYPRYPGRIGDRAGLRRIIDGYDCGVAYADSLVGQVLDLLEGQGVLDDTAVIITSDHGENLGELGIYSEHATADECTCHIPLIIRWPGGRRGAVDGGLRYGLDLAPTLADLLGVPPWPRWDGESFAPALMSGEDAGRDFLVLEQQAHVCQRSVRFGDYLYIRTIHDGFHLFPREMLFDVAQDPHEQRNLADARPDLCDRAARLMLTWQEDMMGTSDSAVDPVWTVMAEGGPEHTRGQLDGYLKRLENTGRAAGAAALRLRHKAPEKGDPVP